MFLNSGFEKFSLVRKLAVELSHLVPFPSPSLMYIFGVDGMQHSGLRVDNDEPKSLLDYILLHAPTVV